MRTGALGDANAESIARALGGYRRSGDECMARCPCHDDKTPSLSLKDGEAGRVLVHDHAGCSQEAVIAALKERCLWPEPGANGRRPAPQIVATFDYQDERGRLLFQTVRLDPKDFRQRRPDGAGGWAWNIKGVQRVPYRLPELIASSRDEPVFVVEGEKHADALREMGFVATTIPVVSPYSAHGILPSGGQDHPSSSQHCRYALAVRSQEGG